MEELWERSTARKVVRKKETERNEKELEPEVQ